MSKQELLQLSVCDICNLDCIFCSQHETLYGMEKQGIRPSSKMIEVERLEVFFENFKGKKYKTLSLVSSGEFFVHPRWDEILEKVFRFNHNEKVADIIVINSNGTLLTTDKIDQIFDLLEKYPVRFKFVFSINAFSSDTYNLLTGKDLFSKVSINSGYFLQKAKEYNAKERLSELYFSVQFLVVNENHKELRSFIDYWQNKFEKTGVSYELKLYCEEVSEKYSIVVRKAFLPKQKEADELFENTLKDAGLKIHTDCFKSSSSGIDLSGDDALLKSRFKPPCIALWKYPYVSTDGKITICCRDVSFKYSYGQIKDGRSIEDIMKESLELKNFKEIHVEGKWDKMPLCYRCSGYERDNDDKEDWKEILSEEDENMWFDYSFRMKKGTFFDYYTAVYENDLKALCDYLEYTSKKADRLVGIEDIDRRFFRRTAKDLNFEHWGINPSYPCSYWFRAIQEKDGELFTGCDRSRIPIAIHDIYKTELLNGDLSYLPQQCRDCRERPKIMERDIIYICPERFDEFSLVLGEKLVSKAKEIKDEDNALIDFLKKNKNRKLNEYLWEKVFDEKRLSSFSFEFLYEYFSDDAYSLFSLLRISSDIEVDHLESITERLQTAESYFRLISALLKKKEHQRLFQLFKSIDLLSYSGSKDMEIENILLLTSLSLSDSLDLKGLSYLLEEYGGHFQLPQKIFNVLYNAMINKRLDFKNTISFIKKHFPERVEDVLDYFSVDLVKLDFSDRILFIKEFKDHTVVIKNNESYSHTLFLKKYYYSLYLLLGEKALEYIERANDNRYFRIVISEYCQKKDVTLLQRAWRIAQENDCIKAALSMYRICFYQDKYEYLDKYRFMLYFLEKNGEFREAFKVNLSTFFRYPLFFIKKSINLIMYMTGIKRRIKE